MPKNDANDRDRPEARRESGQPGGGQGRRDEVGGSGVYHKNSEDIPGDAEVRTSYQWGQGERGAEGYEDSGGSELVYRDGQVLGGLTSDPNGRPSIDIHGDPHPELPPAGLPTGEQTDQEQNDSEDRSR